VKVCSVLRSGGEYLPEHAQRLAAQVEKHLPGADFFVLSDVDVPGVRTVRSEYNYRGWWSKMELMSLPEDDFLCFDLDTTIVGDLSDMARRGEFTLLRDFYHPVKLQSGVMYLTPEARAKIWVEWLRMTPPAVRAAHTGDGQFINSIFGGKAASWQDVLPGQVVSYKVHVQLDPTKGKHIGNGFIPPGARVICGHGHPRPWAWPILRFQ
jgi:hypothetical protein